MTGRLARAAAGAVALAALATAGCHGVTSASAPASSSATAASAVATASASGQSASAAPTASPACGHADYCPPAAWETAKASTPLTQIPPFAEPLNVVISARSTVSLAALQQAMPDWKTVSAASSATVAGIHVSCISSERASVAGGYAAQAAAWRLGGCLKGNELSLTGDEDHVRIWRQPVAGSKDGASFIAASFETMCLVRDGKLQAVSANKGYAVLHPGSAYHCVDGGPGSITTRHRSGYDDASAAFAAAVTAAARARGWQVAQRTVTVHRQAHAGEGGVPFGDTVRVLTVTS